MASLEALVTSGRIVDIALLVLAAEVVAIQLYRRRTGGGIPLVPMLMNLGAGGSIMLALRAALTDSGWTWVAVFLVTSLVFHVADQLLRWQK